MFSTTTLPSPPDVDAASFPALDAEPAELAELALVELALAEGGDDVLGPFLVFLDPNGRPRFFDEACAGPDGADTLGDGVPSWVGLDGIGDAEGPTRTFRFFVDCPTDPVDPADEGAPLPASPPPGKTPPSWEPSPFLAFLCSPDSWPICEHAVVSGMARDT